MNEIVVRRAASDDVTQLLRLQNRNHVSRLPQEQRGDGFLTTELSAAQWQQIIDRNGVFVAVAPDVSNALDAPDLAGYVVAAPWSFFLQWPIFGAMTARFPLSWRGNVLTTANSFQYGPVCVAHDWRGRGVLPAMFATARTEMKAFFPFGATFINTLNVRSMAAHTRKLGFETIDSFEWNANRYQTLAFRC